MEYLDLQVIALNRKLVLNEIRKLIDKRVAGYAELIEAIDKELKKANA